MYGRAALLVTAKVQHLHDASSSWQVDNDKYDLPEVQVVDPNLDAKLAEQLEAANQGLRHAQKRFADLVSSYDTLACLSTDAANAALRQGGACCNSVARWCML